MAEDKKILFSGIKPSGDLTIGNYLGAIKAWVNLQKEYNCYFCVVDMHAITVHQNPGELRKRTLEILAIYIAAGIDIEKNTLFIQSHVPEHTELSWLLTCNSYVGELSRMTQYKEKSKKAIDSNEAVPAGLFNYPVLMAADILLYQADLVPVGIDQRQHLELTRNIAERFNHTYSDTFNLPEAYVPTVSAKIMDLQYPERKMSKSDDNPNGAILLMDDATIIRRKIEKAITDSIGVINYTDEQPGVKNLINIFSSFLNVTPEEIVDRYKGKSYSVFKRDLAETVINELDPIQKRVNELLNNKETLESIYRQGAEKAQYAAMKTLRKVKKKIGLIPLT